MSVKNVNLVKSSMGLLGGMLRSDDSLSLPKVSAKQLSNSEYIKAKSYLHHFSISQVSNRSPELSLFVQV